MSIDFSVFAVLVCLAISVFASSSSGAERIILDTDLGADCDDAGALAVMHALADKGEVEVVAIGIVNTHPNAVPAAHAINTWYGRGNVPIGTIKRETGFKHDRYLFGIVKDYPHTLTKDTAPDVVKMYRQILANSPDKSLTLVTIGPATNISDLLDSGPDDISPLTGIELVTRKLKFYAAGGNGDGKLPHGRPGWNYQMDKPSAKNELAKMPSDFPMIFAGGSGYKVEVGECYRNAPADHIIRRAYVDYFGDRPSMRRPSWDQLRMLFACRPSARHLWDVSPGGDITYDIEKVEFHWSPEPNRGRAYAYVKDLPGMARELESLMTYHPRKAK